MLQILDQNVKKFQIPNAVTIASVSLNAAGNVLGQSRICGRFFGAVTPNGIATQSNTICSKLLFALHIK
jgi:hypothetical protein